MWQFNNCSYVKRDINHSSKIKYIFLIYIFVKMSKSNQTNINAIFLLLKYEN